MTLHLKGFVFSIENFKEDDLNLIFFSQEQGKIRILVKGARKPGSKLIGLTQFFVLLDLVVVKGKNIHLIGGREIKNFKNIFKNFEKIIWAHFVLNKLNSLTPFLKKDKKIFALTLKTLEKINIFKKEKSKTIALSFLIKFLTFSGFRPEIKKCLTCQKSLQNDFAFFDFKQGGVICSSCQKTENPDQIKISLEILRILQNLLYKNFDFLKEKDFPAKNLNEISDILEKFLAWRQ